MNEWTTLRKALDKKTSTYQQVKVILTNPVQLQGKIPANRKTMIGGQSNMRTLIIRQCSDCGAFESRVVGELQ